MDEEARLGEGVREMRVSVVSGENSCIWRRSEACTTGIVGSVGERVTKGGKDELATDFSLMTLSLSASSGFFSKDVVGSFARAAHNHFSVNAPPSVSTAAHIVCQTSTSTRTKSMRRATLAGGCDVVFDRSDDRRVDGRRDAGFNEGVDGGGLGSATFFARVAMNAGEDKERRG